MAGILSYYLSHATKLISSKWAKKAHNTPPFYIMCCVHYFMKKVQLFNKMSDFEKFINRTDIDVIQVDVKVVEQSCMFQESFAAVVFYKVLS